MNTILPWYAGVWLGLILLGSTVFAGNADNTLHVGQLSDPHTLNPFQVATADSAAIARNLYEALLHTDADGQVVAGQAESWRIEDGGKRFIFTLRSGLRWSNGEALVAQDFVAGFRYQADPANGFHRALELKLIKIVNIDQIIAGQQPVEKLGVYAPDKKTVVVELSVPVSHAIYTFTSAYPLYRPAQERHGSQWARVGRMVVNGAYRPTTWLLNERLEIERNPLYRQASQVAIGKVVFYPLAAETELKQFTAGQLDMTATVPPGKAGWLKQRFGARLKGSRRSAVYFYTFNLKQEKFQDKRLRQALAYALDRRLITDKVVGFGEPAASTFALPESLPLLPEDIPLLAMTQQQRVELAKQRYREAGYSTASPLKVEILYNTLESHRQIALAVADMWKRHLGVQVSLRNMEWNALEAEVRAGKFEVLRLGWQMGHANACFLYPLFESLSAVNLGFYSNPVFDSQAQAACYSHDPNVQNRAMVQAERILAEDMPAIPLFYSVDNRLVSDRVKGYPRPDQYFSYDLKELRLESR